MEEKFVNNSVYKMLTEGWPKVDKQASNPQLVRALFSVFGGRDSELTLLNQYLYQAMVLREQNNMLLSELFDATANDQMQHIRHLGRLICRYGGEPRFISYIGGRGISWSSGNIYYEKNADRMLDKSILCERQILRQYKTILNSNILDTQPKQLIERIMKDTEHHINLFNTILNN